MLLTFALVLLGYLFGSVSAAILVCRALGLPDPRASGSHNPGATNVLRIGGKKAAALTLLGDFLKGTLPVLAARALGADDISQALVGLAAFLGHLYPVFFRFRGGKGVATGLGVILAWSWVACAATAGTWLLMAAAFRISSLSALTAFLLAPAYLYAATGSRYLGAAMLLITVLTYWRHRSNIAKLLEGSEGKLDRKG
ncbi:glycerol-3-phosphate 1-O-acyltransferase PlsY [Alkalilimnicola sp. S0819]|uniref:glycerol-3-phosphate 1-O-acyltransferase PlsY n=1 Tax=Alkalilimnicola sp. S0819 TaxID=2613922 RepID=UPI001262007B|nr:glycerol-3-phosphate 1-O-acyltransferase PlsY [Alkalilimnicola sp. S0819]KAB7627303.1 glycerol-3-phosphate 1-O-acyltransferase PlsY [Alkalilimnicola sp. S0819]MPQ16017.1 glycerol-3-phosphate 1-O-acyltransferase PlsY [Alkalilimnicola sp. S0819]